MHSIYLCLRLLSVSIRGQMQYRVSFLLQTFGHMVQTGIEFIGIVALFARFGQLRGWSLAEVAFIYGMANVTFSISDALGRGFDVFGPMVKSGDFDRLLVRPQSTVVQLLGQELTLRRSGRFVQGFVVLGWSIMTLHLEPTLARALLFAVAAVCGVCTYLGLVILEATSAFWATETLEVWNAFTYGGVFMSGYPATIYRSWFRGFFTFVIPLTCVSYFPAVAILGRPDPLGTPVIVQWLAPLSGFLFLGIALQVWQFGVRHYRSTGS